METISVQATETTDEESRTMAVHAWNRQFECRQLDLTVGEPEPFKAGQRIGSGGMGTVHETVFHGIRLALKRTYTMRLTPQQLNEIKVLGRISTKRHRHIVELIGSYTHRLRVGYEVGMLIWPVAHTDLAKLFGNIQSLITLLHLPDDKFGGKEDWQSRRNSAMKRNMDPLLVPAATKSASDLSVEQSAWELIYACQRRIQRSIGCIAEAVAHLHHHKIRHKDLKPSQILMSPHGLWVTDFGWSVDTSEMETSVTSGGEVITTKYHAPERDNRQPCGRAEDVFSLGCIYLEMSYAMLDSHQAPSAPWAVPQTGFSFHGQLSNSDDWIQTLLKREKNVNIDWLALVRMMLSLVDKERPTIRTVLKHIHAITRPSLCLVDTCCSRPLPTGTEASADAVFEGYDPEITLHIQHLIERQVAIANDPIPASPWNKNSIKILFEPPVAK
jgi:serine/threonine protein kinase